MKRWARVTLKILGGLLLGVVTLAAAWAAFNNRLVDDAPRPVPEALRVPASTLPAKDNAMFGLLGLEAAGEDPHTEGLRAWARIEAGRFDEIPPLPRRWPSSSGDKSARAWQCDAQAQDCVAVWTREEDGLRALMDTHAEVGRRCEAVARPGMMIEEPLIAPAAELSTAKDLYIRRATILPWRSTVECLRWLQIRSVLAGRSGDGAAMMSLLAKADALTVAMLEGTRTLIGVNVAGAMGRRHWQVLTDIAARHPGQAPAMRAMLRPLSPQAIDATRWIQTEANFGREAVREMACSDLGADPARIAPDDPLHCVPQIWAMPHATQHLLDEQWLRARTLADGGILALLAWDPDLMAARPWGLPVWRNSIGHMLVAVGSPGFTLYVRKQASLLLLNEAARLALAAGEVEPAKRAAWLTQQPMDARLRERLAIDGDHVVARVWEPVSSQDTLRYRIPPGATSAATVTGSHPGPSPSKS